MGAKTSSQARSQSDKAGKVQRREGGRRGKERPLSAPTGEGAVSIDPGFYQRGTGELTGRLSSSQQNLRTNPLPDDDWASASGPFVHDTATTEQYRQAREQVLGIWPEYHPLRELDTGLISPPGVSTLQKVFHRLWEQHTLIASLSREKHDMSQMLQNSQEERKVMLSTLRSQDEEVNGLQTDIALLKDELRKYGAEIRLPERTRTPRPEVTDGASDKGSDAGADQRPTYAQRLQQKANQGFVMATPLVQMGDIKNMQAALQRKTSMRSGGTNSVDSGYTPGSDPTRLIEDLNRKVKKLQMELEAERRGRGGGLSRTDSMSRRKGIAMDTIVAKYKQHSTEATDRIYDVVKTQLGHVIEDRISAFICTVMQAAFETCNACVQRFHTHIQSLLLNPTRLDGTDKAGNESPRTGGAVLRKVSKLEAAQDRGVSRLALRTWASGEVPQALMDQITTFLEQSSELASLTSVIEDVVDALRKEFPECTTSALLNHHGFNQFLHSCCRLAWQMNVINPPMEINADISRPFDERHHMQATLADPDTTSTEINYFVWPTLYSRKHGDVLVKGLVCLYDDTLQL